VVEQHPKRRPDSLRQSKIGQRGQRGRFGFGGRGADAPLDPLTENRKLLSSHHSEVVGKKGFYWREELSEDGQKLYGALIEERGDSDLLPQYAAEDEFDLNGALAELRGHGLLDESDPELIKLIRRKL